MSPDSPPPSPRPPHPLTVALIARLRDEGGTRVVELGAGSGRNTRALVDAGITVVGLGRGAGAQAAIATHALLHGTPASITHELEAIARSLVSNAPLYATFGSVQDRRYGIGEELEPFVYALRDGDEAGIAHAFFDRARLLTLLESGWTIESMQEMGVDGIAGTWAHREAPLQGAVHWFVVARKRAS
jgi:hypothetical protein